MPEVKTLPNKMFYLSLKFNLSAVSRGTVLKLSFRCRIHQRNERALRIGFDRNRTQASICTAETLLPKFEYFVRKCTRSYTRASAGFWPHFRQGEEVLAEPVILRNLVRFGICSPLVCHFQELDQRRDVFFNVVHDSPLRNAGEVHVAKNSAVLEITKIFSNLT